MIDRYKINHMIEKLTVYSPPSEIQIAVKKNTNNTTNKTANDKDHAHKPINDEVTDRVEIADDLKELLSIAKASQKVQKFLADQAQNIIKVIPEATLPIQTINNESEKSTFFISGFKLKGLENHQGMDELKELVNEGLHFGWRDKSEIISEIQKRSQQNQSPFPIVLAGHGFGADTAIEVAKELQRTSPQLQIDLLFTIDAVGFDNDVIPTNVKKVVNIVGKQDALLNDGAKIAQDKSKTQIDNILRENETHEELEKSWGVQSIFLKNYLTVQNNFKK